MAKARDIQQNRFSKIKPKIRLNSEMSSKQVDELVDLDAAAENFLKIYWKNLCLGAGILPDSKNQPHHCRSGRIGKKSKPII